jgi:hypothetical protein
LQLLIRERHGLLRAAFEAWIAADPFGGGVRVTITGPHGFERTTKFPTNEDPASIAERVRATLEDC